jgi:hypothetical protein
MEINRCTRCILPDTFPGITFDHKGVCNFCSDHQIISALGEAKLLDELPTQRDSIYDCIVPISGGKDSTYVLYYAVKKLNLRVIAVNYDSGFQSNLARENIRNICNKLSVPVVIITADYKTHLKMLGEILHISEVMGMYFHTCMNCEVNIRSSVFNTAIEYDIPYILYGDSKLEGIEMQPFLGRKAFLSRIPKSKAPKLFFHLVKYSLYSTLQRKQTRVPGKYRYQPFGHFPFPESGPKVIHFFDYIEWNSIEKGKFLSEKLEWKSPESHNDRFDCLLHCFGNHHWLQQCGISVDGYTYSTMIRANRMKRDDAILRENAIIAGTENDCMEVIKKAGLVDFVTPNI